MRLHRTYAVGLSALVVSIVASCGGDDDGQVAGDDGGGGADVTAGESGNADHYAAPSTDGTPPMDSTPPSDTGVDGGIIIGASVLQHHLNASRDGHYVDPLITPTTAGNMHVDTTFNATLTGPVWAQPLYVENGPNGKGIFIVVSDSNDIYALDETTGSQVWHVNLGSAPNSTGGGCNNAYTGNRQPPVGVNGTPVIDLASRTMYFNEATAADGGTAVSQDFIHGLSIDDGREKPGWPVLVSVTSGGVSFNGGVENQRGALALLNGHLYVPYGGFFGDCGPYHGWIIDVPVANPTAMTGYSTPGLSQGGMWATGGVSSDGIDVFVASGNADNNGGTWGGGEAVYRFHDGTTFTNDARDYFYPSNYAALDTSDTDIGASNPIVVDAPAATPSRLVVQFGKNGNIYVLDRTNLGGQGHGDGTTGEGLFSVDVATQTTAQGLGDGNIMNAGAAFSSGGNTYVVLFIRSAAKNCPKGQSGNLMSLLISGNPVTATPVWCQSVNAAEASPIVTTTDQVGSKPIVWITGAEGDNQLHGFDGLSGDVLYPSPDGGGFVQTDQMSQILHFTTLIAVKGRLIIGAQNRLYAFRPR
jgi:PQQ enzyme repeat